MRTGLQAVKRNALAFIGGYLISLALVQFGSQVLGGWPASAIGQLIGFVAGLALAVRLRVKPVAYLWAAMTASTASEVLFHLRYGINNGQAGPMQFAVIGAACAAVVIGAWIGSAHRFTSVGPKVSV